MRGCENFGWREEKNGSVVEDLGCCGCFCRRLWGEKKFKLRLLFWPVEVEEDGWTIGCFGEKEWRPVKKNKRVGEPAVIGYF